MGVSARAVGPIATLALAGVIELLDGTSMRVTNPPAFFVLAIVFAASSGGLGSGLISAVVAWVYTAYFFAEHGEPLRYADPNLRRVVVWALVMPLIAVMVGVLNRRVARAAHAEAVEKRFRVLLDHASDAIEIVDPKTGRFLDVNEKACQTHGYTREEYLALTIPDIDPLMTPDRLERSMDDVRGAGTQVIESQHRRKDGSVFPVEINKTYIRLDRDYMIAVVRDITERKRAEALVTGQNRILEMIALGLPLRDVLTNLMQTIESQVDGMICSVLLLDEDGVHVRRGAAPSIPDAYMEALHGLSIGPRAGSCGTAMYLRKPVIVTDILEDPLWDECRPLAAPYGLRACWSTPIVAHDGTVLGSFAIYYREVRSPGATETGLVEIATNLAGVAIQRTRSEEALRASQEQLRHAQKLEAVGRLAGGVAHDFNNLLTVINGCSELVANTLASGDPNRDLLGEVQKAGERAAHLTQQLLAFSRKQVLQPQIVSLNVLLRDLLKLLQRLIGEDVELALVADESLGLAEVDPGQFEQAVTNLVVNARDAMPHGGRLTIETHNADLDAEYAERFPDVAPGQYVLVVVTDSGEGMDAATKARIFEPFFTTKQPGKGTGLGLAMVYGFVKQSGGHIEVHSEPTRGTTFKLYLPRAEKASAPESPTALRDAPKGTETILLVEDEDAVRALVKRVLSSSGYVVLEAHDGPDAVAVAGRHQGPIDLLVTDLVMPRMSGRQLASQLAEHRPQMRILFMSGYSDEAVLPHQAIGSDVGFLQKPFTPIGLARKIREVLDAEA